MKNMKIPVENNLEEIVAELERLGYEYDNARCEDPIRVIAYDDGFYMLAKHVMGIDSNYTTLDELKEM